MVSTPEARSFSVDSCSKPGALNGLILAETMWSPSGRELKVVAFSCDEKACSV